MSGVTSSRNFTSILDLDLLNAAAGTGTILVGVVALQEHLHQGHHQGLHQERHDHHAQVGNAPLVTEVQETRLALEGEEEEEMHRVESSYLSCLVA